jgi:hypothetical protein
MGRLAIRTRTTMIWQKLARLVAVLAAVLFVGHAVATESTFPHAYNHTVAQAGASHLAEDGHGGSEWPHKSSSASGHQHSEADAVKQTCCGEACLMALMPDNEPCLGKPWDVPSEAPMTVAALAGHEPEGLRRPPRLLSSV